MPSRLIVARIVAVASTMIGILVLVSPLIFETVKSYGLEQAIKNNLTNDDIKKIAGSAYLQQSFQKWGRENNCYVPIPVKLSEISRAAQHTVRWQEDRNFYQHDGSRYWSTVSGLARTAIHKPLSLIGAGSVIKPRGGSTITQQFVKLTLFQPTDSKFERKIREIGYAKFVEQSITKNEILEGYFNSVTFRHRIVGVEAFSLFHFGMPASEMGFMEAAQFAVALNNPQHRDPTDHPAQSRTAALRLLNAMRASGDLSDRDYRAAIAPTNRISRRHELYEMSCGYVTQAAERIDAPVTTGPHRTYVTVSSRHQIEALGAVDSRARELRRAGGSQMAMVTLGRDGRLTSIVGGVDIERDGWNRALYGLRPAGSISKIATLAAACEKGYTLATKLRDEPVANDWPRNADGQSHGVVSLGEAITHSYNQAIVQLERKLGIEYVAKVAKDLGFSRAKPMLGLSLGSFDTSPIEAAQVMATIANGGHPTDPWTVNLVVGPLGKVLYRHEARKPGKPVISAACASMVRDALVQVVKVGTASAAGFDRLPAFGKTGTTSKYVDAWFVGHWDGFSTVVWAGNDKGNLAMQGISGGTIPARVTALYFTNVKAVHEERQRSIRQRVQRAAEAGERGDRT